MMIVGTCSICGGYVSVQSPCHGVTPLTPTCQKCGAYAKQSYPMLPEIPMEPRHAYYGTRTHYGRTTHTGTMMLSSSTTYRDV